MDTKQIRLKYKELNKLKRELADTDFKAIKYAEGYYTDEEYATIKKERQSKRSRINELKAEIKSLIESCKK